MTVKDNSYVTIQAFMVNELGLGGNELIIYAVIYGFSQDGSSWYTGSRSYLAEWCQASKSTVSRNLERLCEAGLLEKRTRVENNVTLVDYRATKQRTTLPKMGTPPTQNGYTPLPKMSTHNLEDNLEDIFREVDEMLEGDKREFSPVSTKKPTEEPAPKTRFSADYWARVAKMQAEACEAYKEDMVPA